MATELKTLTGWGEYSSDRRMVLHSLRAEAIKWIKELDKFPDKYNDAFGKTKDIFIIESEYGADPLGLTNWIKHFFNITEEELNDGIRGN